MKKSILTLAVLAAVSLFSACDGGSGGNGGGNIYSSAWYDVYGTYCGTTPRAGCNFYYGGSKITRSSDPYYYSSYGTQYATWQYTDSYGYSEYYTGYAWLSPSGILYTDYGTALNDESANGGRDMMGDVVAAEEAMVQQAGKGLAAKYALAEEVGVNIARSLNEYATLAKTQSRSRTEADVKEFTTRIFGVKYEDAKAAIDSAQAGDMTGVEGVNAQVAQNWSTSPETSSVMLKSFFKNQLSQANVK